MEYNAASWLQSSIADVHDSQSVPHDVGGASGGSQTTLDLSEFGIPDLSGPSTSASTSISNTPTFYTFPQYTSYISNTPGPYNAVQYGSTSWAPSQPQHIPLSSYSTLNGATSTASSSQHIPQQSPQQQQQQQQQHSPPMMIDPALTMNGSNSPSTQYQQASPFISSQPRAPYTYQHFQQQQQQQSPPTINPSFVHTNTSHYQQPVALPRPSMHQQQQQAPQGTLSPYQLHSPPNSSLINAMGTVPPANFYTHSAIQNTAPSSSSVLSQEQRKAAFLSAIKPLLTPTSFTGAGAVEKLVGHIEDYGTADVEPATRLEILTKMRDNAGNHYFRAWVENEGAMDVTREWLKLAFTNRGDMQLLETIMPLLHIIDRLPFNIDTLKSSKLGKIIVKLTKEPPAPAIQDMASNLERKWRMLVESSKRAGSENVEDAKGKKRKAEGPATKVAPPAKKVAVAATAAPSSKTTVVKKEAKGVVKEVKDAKSDQSFFSAPKQKPKLPSFKKAPPAPAVKKEPDQNVAQPSSINPFEEALKLMKSRKDSPATATPPPAPPQSAPPVPTVTISAKTGKLKKTVTWAPEGKLEMIKLIERAVYDDDPSHGAHGTHNIRDLDRDEGAALHAHLFEELVEWSEPHPIQMPIDLEYRPRGEESQEKQTQEVREQSALIAVYTSPEQIPDSPAEPTSQIPEEQVDLDMRLMLTGPEVDAIFWSGGMPAAVEPPKASVAELVGQLAAGGAGADVTMADASMAHGPSSTPGFDVAPVQQGLANLNAEQIQQLLQQVSQVSQAGGFPSVQPPAPPPPQAPAAEPWAAGGQYGEYDRGLRDDAGHDRRWSEDGWGDRGRGRFRGRGRGRGDGFRNNKRKPCSFFAAGRCRYGDQCDFSHEAIFS